ncbi:MAG: transposase [Aphanocapsa sp. GSE-SYN-MK-11-07L]|jgi:putative transposase|nr:transposase [Aphanocapsa sp. GSE-SYN-MK-11-07L]
MKARYQYRFYPTDQQKVSLAQLFGCCRVAWNDALTFCKQAEKLPGYSVLSARLTQLKQTCEREWLKEVSSVPLQQSLRDLDVAYRNFFNSLKGKRKGTLAKPPKFKKKENKQSARFVNTAFSITQQSVYLAKIGTVQPIWSRELPASPSSVTVIKDCADRYFLSFVVDVEPERVEPINPSVGIDLGIKTFAVLSTGEFVSAPDYSKLDRKVRKLQKKLARQPKGAKRRYLTRLRIAKTHNKIADTRKDFLHKLSTKVIRENQSIALEDLNVSGMLKNRKLSKAIAMQGWREFRVLLEAKSKKRDRQFTVISRWEPTSQLCSNCGYRWGKLDLSVRIVQCLSCNSTHDRDENAAKNIDKVGMGHRHDSKRAQRQSKSTSVASVGEASRILTPSG